MTGVRLKAVWGRTKASGSGRPAPGVTTDDHPPSCYSAESASALSGMSNRAESWASSIA